MDQEGEDEVVVVDLEVAEEAEGEASRVSTGGDNEVWYKKGQVVGSSSMPQYCWNGFMAKRQKHEAIGIVPFG